MQADLEMEFERVGQNGTFKATAVRAGTVLHSDTLDLSVASERDRFLDILCKERRGIDRDAVANELLQATRLPHEAKPQTPSAQATITSDDEWPPIRLGKLPPVPAFPVEVFPASVRWFIHSVADAIGCPVDFAALPVLGVAGAGIGASVSLRLKPGYFASSALYLANIGGSSSGKSPALDAAGQPLWDIDEGLHDAYRSRRDSYDAEIDEFERKPKSDRPTKPVKPVLESAVLDDATVEAIAPHLAINNRGLVVVKDELSGWVASLNQYKKGGKGSDRQFYLSALFGKPIRVDRKGHADGEPIRIPHPHLLIVGNMTPDMLGELADKMGRSDGFIERLLFAFPDPAPRPHWSETGISDDQRKVWAEIVRKLKARPMAQADDGKQHPHVVHFSPEAKAAWVNWYDAHVDEFNGGSFGPAEQAAEGKLCDFAGRLALILHMLDIAADTKSGDTGDIPPLSVRAVEGAIKLWSYFRAHHRRVRVAIGGKAGNAPEGARLVLRWIDIHPVGIFKESNLTGDIPPFKKDRALMADGLAWLQARGIVRPVSQPTRPKGTRGRKPAPAWEINPGFLLESDNSDNPENRGDRPADDQAGDDLQNSRNCQNPEGAEDDGEEVVEWVA